MATRPAFAYINGKVIRRDFDFVWNPGLSVSQKKKNIAALHAAIKQPALEVSTKSESELGRSLSAFNLTLHGYPLECVYHAGKVMRTGGPYPDLLNVSPREAKHDPRLNRDIIGFEYNGERWPTRPMTAFYDYIYIKSAIILRPNLDEYIWFTDIEFNPSKSISTQARSAALLKAVYQDESVMKDMDSFLEFHKRVYSPR